MLPVRRHAWIGLAMVFLAGVACKGGQPEPTGVDSLLVTDVTGLNQARVAEIVRAERVAQLQEAIARAKREGLKVSIAGLRHSQGGHQFTEGGLLLDMTDFDDILDLDVDAKTITVESGVTWAEVQAALNPDRLAVAVMQSSNIFTVGGTISVNAHGRDPRFGPVIETVRSFRLLTADGRIRDVSREKDAALFGGVLGGFGLFGVILDVELDVVPNALYEKHVVAVDYRDYPEYFRENVQGRGDIGLQSARLSIVPGDGFLRDMYQREYREIAADTGLKLRHESNVGRDRFFFNLSRRYDWGKQVRWWLQHIISDRDETISRNNAMRPPIAFLTYHSDQDTDILQEYFVPIDSLVVFVDGMRDIMREEEINLLHVNVRYVPKNEESLLSYSREDVFAIVMYINIETSDAGIEHARDWTQQLVDLAIAKRGTYFLAYQGFPTYTQSRLAYPTMDVFFARKRGRDSDLLFSNRFYEQYALPGSLY